MSKWAFGFLAAAVLAVGCAGGGSSSTGGGGGTGGNTTDSTAFVTLPNVPGVLQSVYLTGQGRAQGDPIAVIRREVVDDSGGTISTVLSPILHLQLNGYTQQIGALNIPTTISRLFDHYNLEVQELDIDNGDGTYSTYQKNGGTEPLVQQSFDAHFRIFPARQTSLAVRLDDSMFVLDTDPQSATYGQYLFDANQFTTANFSQDHGNPAKMNGYLSDYVMFDISQLSPSDQPQFPDASGTATAFFMNGDNFALGTLPSGPIGQAPPDPLPFFVLTPIGYVAGQHVGPRTAVDPNTGQTTALPGTYSLVQPDPRDPLNPASKITALIGTYNWDSKTLNSLGTNPQGFEIIAFPSSEDDGVDDIVLFNISGSTISKLYFGQLDMNAGTITAYPVSQITDAGNTSNEITGTVSNLVNGSGGSTTDVTVVHAGKYTLNAANLPATFSTSGRFIVYRR